MKPLNPLEMADQLDRPVWWLTKPEGDQRRAAAALLREMAAEIDRLRAAAIIPAGDPGFEAWWDAEWRVGAKRAIFEAYAAGAASVLKGGAASAQPPVIYFDNAGNLISRVSQEQVEVVLSDALDRIRGVSSAPRRSASQ